MSREGLAFLGFLNEWDDLIARLDRIEDKLDAVVDMLDKRGKPWGEVLSSLPKLAGGGEK
jgi:hypothetical protein